MNKCNIIIYTEKLIKPDMGEILKIIRELIHKPQLKPRDGNLLLLKPHHKEDMADVSDVIFRLIIKAILMT